MISTIGLSIRDIIGLSFLIMTTELKHKNAIKSMRILIRKAFSNYKSIHI